MVSSGYAEDWECGAGWVDKIFYKLKDARKYVKDIIKSSEKGYKEKEKDFWYAFISFIKIEEWKVG